MTAARLCTAACALLVSGLDASAQQTPLGTDAVRVAPGETPVLLPLSIGTNAVSQIFSDSQTNLVLKEVRPGIFELGDVRIDKRQRTVSFPALLNLSQGPMEYLLVASWGKVHESVLRTETEPYRIHLAMLLLRANPESFRGKAQGTNTLANGGPDRPGGFIAHPSSARLPGDAVSLELRWKVNGKETRKPAEELVSNLETKSVMRKGNWIYNGSRLVEDMFLAEVDGSVVSLITDPAALINNTGPGHANDAIWTAQTNNLPPPGVPVEVTIRLGVSDH